MVFFGVVFQGKVLRALVQILQAQQGANPLVERELVADHDVGVATGVGASIAEKPGKIKPPTAIGSLGQSGSVARRKADIPNMQREYLCFQHIEISIIVNDVVRLAQPFLSGSL
jgi:hypothetical protein